jgi:hypothetical protein
MFDPVTYFENLTAECTLTDGYHFARISSILNLEEILQNRKKKTHFVAVEDSENGITTQAAGHGFWERRPYTVFLCAVAKFGDMDQRELLLEQLRDIYRAFLSRMIKDRCDNNLLFVNLDRIPFYEIPGFIGNGCVGIYFVISVDNQIDMTYDSTVWTAPTT